MLKNFNVDNYSFLNHPVEKLHDVIPELLPGIGKMITVHYDESTNRTIGNLSEKRQHRYTTQFLNIDKALPALNSYMEGKNPFDWLNPDNLPFDLEIRRPNPGIDLFSELENIVLLLRIFGNRNLHDLVFIYLEENPRNFGITDSNKPLSAENKGIIAFLVSNAINSFLRLQSGNKVVLKSHNTLTRQIIEQTESLKGELHRTKENYGVSLVKLCQQYIHDFTSKSGITYKLSDGALEKIKAFKGEIKELEGIIRKTILYIDSLYTDHSGDIEILEWHIIFDTPVKSGQAIPVTEKEKEPDVYSRTITLLDKLENAALILKGNKSKLTGTNVGKAFPVPVSAPAISDALYNHRGKINNLMKKYPSKWETIRRDFRPLRNILKDENIEDQNPSKFD